MAKPLAFLHVPGLFFQLQGQTTKDVLDNLFALRCVFFLMVILTSFHNLLMFFFCFFFLMCFNSYFTSFKKWVRIFICLPRLAVSLYLQLDIDTGVLGTLTCCQELVARRTGLNSLPLPVLNL